VLKKEREDQMHRFALGFSSFQDIL
jgi:hypothetical protein